MEAKDPRRRVSKGPKHQQSRKKATPTGGSQPLPVATLPDVRLGSLTLMQQVSKAALEAVHAHSRSHCRTGRTRVTRP